MFYIYSQYFPCAHKMEEEYDINRLDEVLNPYLDGNRKVESFSAKLLTKPGENYGSLMLALNVTTKDGNGKEEILPLVAKMCPPNEWIKKMFNVQLSFKKENSLYEDIAKIMRTFEQEHGLPVLTDFFAQYYGSRISLDPRSDIVDDDAVLLLENLKTVGYSTSECMVGFDLQTATVLVNNLAIFHAVPLAIKIKKPDFFKVKILPNLRSEVSFSETPDEIKAGSLDKMIVVAEKNEHCLPLPHNFRKYLVNGQRAFEHGPKVREPFATIGHSDYWTNNILVKYENDGTIKTKMLDFQVMDYGSPARDLIFLLYSSVQSSTVSEHYDELINIYYTAFINTLKLFNCDVSPFTFDAFQEELQIEARESQLFHCLMMLSPIFAKRDKVRDMREMGPDMFLETEYSEGYEQKIHHVILSFMKNKWI